MISVRELTKLYGTFTAVDSVSFDVAAGEILGLVGPNGAGKTTTLRCIAGIIPMSKGAISIVADLAALSPARWRAPGSRLFEPAGGAATIARLYGVTDIETRGPAILSELELIEKRRALPSELSRGMRQKLAIACGLLHEPRALILDEPLTGLDPGGMRRMRETIVARAAAGAAVILSSHLLNLVEELCTKLIVLRQGRCVAYGSIDDLMTAHPELAGQSLEDVFLALTGHEARGHDPARCGSSI